MIVIFLRWKRTLFFCFALIGVSTAAYAEEIQASFDCSKASSATEKLICKDVDLAKLDKDMAELVGKIRDSYEDQRRESFIKGQRNWLKLRIKACLLEKPLPADDPVAIANKTECLSSVYNERIQELTEQSEIQAQEKKINPPIKPDLDIILDTERDLTAYFPHEMSAMYYLENDEILKGSSVTPSTCRELFTFKAGHWTHGDTTVGMNSYSTALAECSFAIFSGQNWDNTPRAIDSKFQDITQYSTEFAACYYAACQDEVWKRGVMSFAEQHKRGYLKIVKGKFPVGNSNDYQDNQALLIDGMNFTINGGNNGISQLIVGDFTHRGRREALFIQDYFPTEGTMRNNYISLAYYDPKTHCVRPEKIGKGILMLKTESTGTKE